MTEITLQDARTKHAELGALIAALMAQAVTTITVEAIDIELREGESYAGTVLNTDGTVKHHTVLMAEKPPARLNWKGALAWAESVGGSLPTRQEAALIFANCKSHVEAVWHWTSEEHESNASYAWGCHFDNGTQDTSYKSSEGSVRAVRRLNP